MSLFHGVYAAVLTPRYENGELHVESYRHQLRSLNRQEIVGFAINGATGEFTRTSEQELDHLLSATREASPQSEILCGIGANDIYGAIRRAKIAAKAKAKAVLLPTPCFFPYRQDDLHAFVMAIASEIELPILLYNLPQFTSGLDVDTVLSLFADNPNIVGIKDSSGSLEVLRAITKAKLPVARLVGHDGVLCDALAEGVCDGIVSGLACVIPEVIISIFSSGMRDTVLSAARAQLDEFIQHISLLPTPWGLKVTSAIRGYTQQSFPFPLSPARERETAALSEWFLHWYPQMQSTYATEAIG